MTEETKTCNCKEKAIEKLKEFLFIAGAVFVGSTLAILLSAQILKPKCPCPQMQFQPKMERPLPPPPAIYPGQGMPGDFHAPKWRHDRGFRGPNGGHSQMRGNMPQPQYGGPQGGPPPQSGANYRENAPQQK